MNKHTATHLKNGVRIPWLGLGVDLAPLGRVRDVFD
ncbi:MAG: hypothetical protein K0Q73_6931 [Paenibacillus sp.]|nr:hypothetical protein [Paenibacillus sp.]